MEAYQWLLLGGGSLGKSLKTLRVSVLHLKNY